MDGSSEGEQGIQISIMGKVDQMKEAMGSCV